MSDHQNFQHARVKICGITRVEDMMVAYRAGADAIGLVFYQQSPRAVSIELAREILQNLPPFMTTVGLFVNAKAEYIRTVLQEVHLDILQFHGDEIHEDCIAYDRPYIKAIRVRDSMDIAAKIAEYPDTMAVLLDSYVEGVQGGTGVKFNWQLIPDKLNTPVILAGGLTVANVADAIRSVRPYAVDVSGGVELDKGFKDKLKIDAFMKEVKHASSQQ